MKKDSKPKLDDINKGYKGKKELLDINASIVATSVLLFDTMKLDKFLEWTLKITLKTQLPQSFRDYKVKLSLNEEPYKMKIEDLEKRVTDIESENQLFEGNKKQQIKDIKEEIKEIEAELKQDLENTPEIEFNGIIQKLEYKNGDTVVTLWIPADTANEINKVRGILKTYKVDLIRE